MCLVVAVVSVAIALARTAVIGRVRRLGPRVSRVGGALLVVAGEYVVYYGWREIGALRGELVDDAAERIQHGVANGLDRLGVGGVLVVQQCC
jgi:cytochrome c-type biogenesis protein